MEPNTTMMIKSFAGGFILGYLVGYFIRKGLKIFFVFAIMLAVILYITDVWDSLLTIWSLVGSLLTKVLSSTIISLKDMIGVQMTGNAFSIGFLVGLGMNFIMAK